MANTNLHRTPTRSVAVAGKHRCRPKFPGLEGDQALSIQPSALAGYLKLQQAHPLSLKLFQRTVFLPGPRRHRRKQLHCLCLHKWETSSAYRHQVCPRGTRMAPLQSYLSHHSQDKYCLTYSRSANTESYHASLPSVIKSLGPSHLYLTLSLLLTINTLTTVVQGPSLA